MKNQFDEMAEYAFPTDIATILEDHRLIVQRAIMLTSDDAHLYARQCRKLGASTQIRGLEVKVVYWLDADGMIQARV